MKMGLSAAEGTILHGLLEESAGDIVLKLDEQGFIIHASENFAGLGIDLSLLLLSPHIADLAERSHADDVCSYARSILEGRALGGWVEFPAVGHPLLDEDESCHTPSWYALSLRPFADEEGNPGGAIGLMRSVQHLRSLEGELHASVLTDPLTGLANRHAFCASLKRHLASGCQHTVAVFAVDRMRALFMQYGQRAADEVQWGLAKFLEAMVLPGQELAQLDEERFVVILPDMTIPSANEWASDVLRTFASLTVGSSGNSPKLSASAGIAGIECTVDWTLRQAELALVMARAGGGMQVGRARRLSAPDGGRTRATNPQLGVANGPR
ncbi:MAG: diguanylate cyclase [Erythrobacter sp.]|nr:diguanylate cyclase [Erythrobacter sp.]